MPNGAVSVDDQMEFSDADWRVVDNGDQSKKLAFQISGLTTATTRIATWPDKSGTVAMTSDITTTTAASQSDQETSTSNTVMVTPAVQQFHPSAAKFWAIASADGTTLSASYNVTSITDTGTGNLLVTIATDFSSANWASVLSQTGVIAAATSNSTNQALNKWTYEGTKAAGTIQLLSKDGSNTASDPNKPYGVIGFGDQ